MLKGEERSRDLPLYHGRRGAPIVARALQETRMFSVIFEVHPKAGQWEAYLNYARMLRPELEQIDGFADNIRYRSLRRPGWILSLSNWRDEKAVVRWRTRMRHHEVQELGRGAVFSDYHLRVGEITEDTKLPAGYTLQNQRLDETEAGEGACVVMANISEPEGWERIAQRTIEWDVFEAVLTPGDLIVLATLKDAAAGEEFERAAMRPEVARLRRVRVIRDYGMYDRREAPQYYPEVRREE